VDTESAELGGGDESVPTLADRAEPAEGGHGQEGEDALQKLRRELTPHAIQRALYTQKRPTSSQVREEHDQKS